MHDDTHSHLDDTAPPARDHGRNVRVVVGSSLDDLVVLKSGSDPVSVTAVEREALVLGQLRHPNVVELLRVDRTPAGVTLVTQFAGRTTLAQLRPTEVAGVAKVAASLLAVVGDLHRLGWAHGRLRDEHCIVGPGGRITLCAFGAAHRVSPDDERIADDLDAVVRIVRHLAGRLGPATSRSERRRQRRLHAALDAASRGRRSAAARLADDLESLGGGRTTPVAVSVGPVVGPAVGPAGDDTTDPGLRHSHNRRPAHSPRRVARRGRVGTRGRTHSRSWRGALVSAAALAALIGAIALLRWIGGPLTNPLDTGRVASLDDVLTAVAVALAAIRIAAVAAAVYGIALSSATLAAILTDRPDVERLATRMAPPGFRRVIVAIIGLGLVASAVGPASPRSDRSATSATTSTTSTTTTTAPTSIAPASPDATDATDTDVVAAAQPLPDPLPRLWVIEPGDHLWGVAEATLAEHLGRPVTDAEVAPYWRAVVDLNRDSLADPDNPDLVMQGQVIELPPPFWP